MAEQIQQRVVKNSLVGFISFVLTLSQAIILVPILLKNWGQEKYGLWIALFAIFNFLQSIDLGHQTFIQNSLNISFHQNIKKFREILGSSFIIAVFIGLIQLLFCILIILSGRFYYLIGTTPELVKKEYLEEGLLALMVMWVVFGSLGGILGRILIPIGKMVQAQYWGIVMRLTQMFSLLIVAFFGGSILQACIFYALIQSAITLLLIGYIKQNTKEIYPWWEFGNIKIGYLNFKKSFQITINNIATQGSNNGIVLFIGNVLHISIIPVFTTIKTLTNIATSVSNLFLNSIAPDISRFYATNQYQKLITIFKINWLLTGLIVNLGFFILVPYIENIYIYWTKGEIGFNPNLFYLLFSSVSLINFGSGFNYFLICSNSIKAQSIITYSRLFSLYIISFFLINTLGIAAIGMGFLFSELIGSCVLPLIFINNIFKKFNSEIKLNHLVFPAIASLIVLIYSLISLLNFGNGYLYYLSLTFLILVYIAEWFSLDYELKYLIKGIFLNFKRLNFYQRSI